MNRFINGIYFKQPYGNNSLKFPEIEVVVWNFLSMYKNVACVKEVYSAKFKQQL